MNTFPLTIITPDGIAFEGEVGEAVAPGVQGEFGVLAHHAPMVAACQRGVLRLDTPEGEQFFVVDDALLEVHDNLVTILADSAEPAGSRDEALKILHAG